MICVPMVPLFALASASSLFPKTPRRFPRMLVAFVAAAAAFVLYVESRRRLFPAPIPPDFAKGLHKPLAGRVFAAIMRWYAQPVLPKDPLNNPLAMTDTAHRIAGALRVYFRGLLQVVFPKALSGDYSAPQEPIPKTLVFPESVLGALCLVLPVPIAGYLGLKAFFDGLRSKSTASALVSGEAPTAEPTKVFASDEVPETRDPEVPQGSAKEDLDADRKALEAFLPSSTKSLAPPEPTDLRPLVAVSLLWVIASYFPVSNIPILLPTVRAERFWYFPVVGTSILLAVFFIWLVERAQKRALVSAERGSIGRVAAGVLAIALGTALTLVTYFADAESRVGNYAVTTGLVVYGVVSIVRGVRSSGTNGKVAWRELAITSCVFFTLYQCMAARLHANDYTTDLTFWDATRKAVPNSSKAHLNYSVMKGARGDLEARRLANMRALELAPEWPMASIYLGDTLCRMHRAEEAWPHYKKGFGLASNDVNLLSLGIQCMWDEKFIGPLPKPENGEPAAPEPAHRAELRALAAQHPGSWLEWLTNDIVANGETHNGVDPKYRPRGYNEGPKE
jgi:protein O-mannosyl-transferase